MSIFGQNYLLPAGTWTSISHSSVVTRSDKPVLLNAITKVSTEPLRPQGHARGIHKASPGWRLQRKGRCNCAGTSSTARDVIGVGWPWRNWRLCYFKRNDAYQIGAREHRVSNMKPLLGHVSRMLIVLVELIVSSSGGSQYLSTVRYIRACGQSLPQREHTMNGMARTSCTSPDRQLGPGVLDPYSGLAEDARGGGRQWPCM